MQKKLNLPAYRRIVGGALIASGFVMGITLLVIGTFFEVDSIYQAAAFPFEPSASTLGVIMVAAASVTTPSIFHPCLFDKFPDWFDKLPREMVNVFAQMLGAR